MAYRRQDIFITYIIYEMFKDKSCKQSINLTLHKECGKMKRTRILFVILQKNVHSIKTECILNNFIQ